MLSAERKLDFAFIPRPTCHPQLNLRTSLRQHRPAAMTRTSSSLGNPRTRIAALRSPNSAQERPRHTLTTIPKDTRPKHTHKAFQFLRPQSGTQAPKTPHSRREPSPRATTLSDIRWTAYEYVERASEKLSMSAVLCSVCFLCSIEPRDSTRGCFAKQMKTTRNWCGFFDSAASAVHWFCGIFLGFLLRLAWVANSSCICYGHSIVPTTGLQHFAPLPDSAPSPSRNTKRHIHG